MDEMYSVILSHSFCNHVYSWWIYKTPCQNTQFYAGVWHMDQNWVWHKDISHIYLSQFHLLLFSYHCIFLSYYYVAGPLFKKLRTSCCNYSQNMALPCTKEHSTMPWHYDMAGHQIDFPQNASAVPLFLLNTPCPVPKVAFHRSGTMKYGT